MAMRRNKKQTQDIKKAYAEFEVGLRDIRQDIRALVERTIKKIDQKQAEKTLKSIEKL